jgi:hypothetical protein
MCLLVLQADPIKQKWEGRGSKIEKPGVEFIGTAEAWEKLWTRHSGEKQAPKVDFSTHAVVAIFPEFRCHTIQSSAAADDKQITITIVLGMKKSPDYVLHHSILVLPRTKLPIVVKVRPYTCTGYDESHDKIYKLEPTADRR